MKPKLRWKMNPKETGLRAVGAGHPGYKLHDGENEYATVSEHSKRWGVHTGWYWSAPSNKELGIPWKNTASEQLSLEEAKEQAANFVKGFLP